MNAKFVVLFTVLVAIITLSAIGDESDATTRTEVFDGEFVQDSFDTSRYLAYTGTSPEELYLSAGIYEITSSADGYILYSSGSAYMNSGVPKVFIQGYNYGCYITSYSNVPKMHCIINKLDDCHVINSYYSGSIADRFSVEMGTYTFVGGSDVYLNLGSTFIRMESSGYIPFDCEDAYFFTYSENTFVIDKAGFTNTPVDYDHEIIAYTSYDVEYQEIYIPAGTYVMKFSADGSLRIIGGYNSYYFDAGEEEEVTIESGMYKYELNHSSSIPYTVGYNISPEIEIEYLDSSYQLVEGKTSTEYMWYKKVIHLGAGEHDLGYWGDCDFTYFLESESSLEQAFVKDVIDKSMTSIPSEYDRSWTLYLDESMDVTFYLITTAISRYNTTISIDSDEYLFDERLIDVEQDSLYVSANSFVKIGTKYDSSKYTLYLVCGEESIPLPNGVIVTLDTDVSKEYLLYADTKVKDSYDSFVCSYEIYTEGLPESDNNATTFAVVAIAICAVFFGLLLISGKRPKWKD